MTPYMRFLTVVFSVGACGLIIGTRMIRRGVKGGGLTATLLGSLCALFGTMAILYGALHYVVEE